MTFDPSDELTERLINLGLVANRYVLEINHSLQVPPCYPLDYPWNLPSRLFRFPIEIGEDQGGRCRLGLRHPLLASHPWVQHVEKELSITIDPGGAPNRHGVSSTRDAQWWHAVDLVTAGLTGELLATRQFTTADNIAAAVAFGLSYSPHDIERDKGYMTVAQARAMLRAIAAPQPACPAELRRGFMVPMPSRAENGPQRWPVNHGPEQDAFAKAWTLVLGIENGWFSHDRSGFLGWTEAGRDRYAGGDSAIYTETGGQGAFAF